MHSLPDDTFIFDFAPMCGPIVMTPRLEKVMKDGIARQAPIGAILRQMMEERLTAFADDGFEGSSEAKMWRASGVKAIQTTLGGLELDPSGWDAAVRDLAWYAHAEHCGFLRICRSADELQAAVSDGILAVLLGTQDAAWADRNFDRLHTLYFSGVRVVQPTYNQRNHLGDGCSEPANGGLSRFGVTFVKHALDLGIIIDLSHSGEQTSFDAIEIADKPIAVTHAACRTLHNHPRTKSDDLLRALRDQDGYFGIVAIPSFLADEGEATVDHMVRHLEHAAEIMGLERVGIATDWGGVTPDMPREMGEGANQAFIAAGFSPHEVPPLGEAIPEFDTYDKWPAITHALLSRFSTEEVKGLVGQHWLSFMERAL